MFPTDATVSSSVLGRQGGGTIHFQPKYWESGDFPKEIMSDCKLLSNGLGHGKLLICSFKTPKKRLKLITNFDNMDGFLYTGSHNFTKAAWGVPSKKRIRMWNWELGLLVPFEYCDQGGFELPFEYPPKRYSLHDIPFSQFRTN
jgi:hypothetical protein